MSRTKTERSGQILVSTGRHVPNLVLVALLALLALSAALHEGYLRVLSPFFWLLLAVGFSASAWLALTISTSRMVSLVLAIFAIEYVKETIGIRYNVWTYHGVGSVYLFGVWAWVVAGVTVYTLATKVVMKLIRAGRFSLPAWTNVAITVVIACLIPATLGKYWSDAGTWFFVFYAVLAIAGICASTRMSFAVFAALVVTAWIISYPSEYAGSVSCRVWTFTHSPDHPPLFLLLGCWPLEILAQYSLSALLAREPLEPRTSHSPGGAK